MTLAMMVVMVLGIVGSGVSVSQAQGHAVMEGNKRLACEAVLCLSSGERPEECTPSLKKFFSIKFKKPWKTVQARKKFLKLCPTGEYDEKTTHVEVLAQGAEICEMENLLQELNVSEPPYSKDLPEVCASFVDHTLTTGFALPVREERCSDAHLVELGPLPPAIEESDPFSGEIVIVNQAERDDFFRRRRLQEFQPTPICVSRWSDPVNPVSEQELTALLDGEVIRIRELSEATAAEEERVFVTEQLESCEDKGIFAQNLDAAMGREAQYCHGLLMR